MTDKFAAARSFVASLEASAGWLNRLERLHVALSDAADAAVEALVAADRVHEAGVLQAAHAAFTAELFGDEDGADLAGSDATPSTPLTPPALLDAALALVGASERIAAASGVLRVDGKVSDADVTAFAEGLYAVQAACKALEPPDKSGG